MAVFLTPGPGPFYARGWSFVGEPATSGTSWYSRAQTLGDSNTILLRMLRIRFIA
jgi:hypothetical protein